MQGVSNKLKVPVKCLHEWSMKNDQGSMHYNCKQPNINSLGCTARRSCTQNGNSKRRYY